MRCFNRLRDALAGEARGQILVLVLGARCPVLVRSAWPASQVIATRREGRGSIAFGQMEMHTAELLWTCRQVREMAVFRGEMESLTIGLWAVGLTRAQRISWPCSFRVAVGDNGRGRRFSRQRPGATATATAMWMMEAGSDGFEMVVMLSAEIDGDVMQCNAMMGAWGGETSVVGAWESAGWIELALVQSQGVPHSSSLPGPCTKMSTHDKTRQDKHLSEQPSHSCLLSFVFSFFFFFFFFFFGLALEKIIRLHL